MMQRHHLSLLQHGPHNLLTTLLVPPIHALKPTPMPFVAMSNVEKNPVSKSSLATFQAGPNTCTLLVLFRVLGSCNNIPPPSFPSRFMAEHAWV
mmetsp:Transcript_15914/g.23275  ORF Transcript_15914/g.23275 Transcript_15914/m.23275 type:complete len:94 (-) Transcript_15914:412-693(-)